MTPLWPFAACALLAAASGASVAQGARSDAASASPAPSAAASSTAAAKPTARARPPAVHVQVIADDNVRIEESRVRGQTQRITVQHKIGPGYEIIVMPGGKDTSQDRGAAGQRAWSLFSF